MLYKLICANIFPEVFDMEKNEFDSKFKELTKIFDKVKRYLHMYSVLQYDQSTVCPQSGMEEHNKDFVEIEEVFFKLCNSPKYFKLIEELSANIDLCDNEYDKVLIRKLNKSYLRDKNITSKQNKQFSIIMNSAFTSWIKAKEENDYNIFKPTLKKIVELSKKKVELSSLPSLGNPLNDIMDSYEEGMTTELLDPFFEKLKERIVPLCKKIRESKTFIRSDFTTRYVPRTKQLEFAKYLLETIGFDLTKGCIGESEHPFTTSISQFDTRVTTHIYENNFISNMYSIIHEGGHGIFGQSIPQEMYDHNIDGYRSLAEDESSSRFFENIIGRSKEFIHLIYPKFHEIFRVELGDVTETELYRAVNQVSFQPIRTEADELTYSLHIMIRYEIEKELLNNNLSVNNLNKLWNKKYKEYLGIDVKNDNEGILQDVHWSSGFGYFPTYSLGNAYNAMYYNRMKQEIDVPSLIQSNNIKEIVNWLKENVYESASYLTPKEWIKKITGRELDPTDYLDYLENKYSELYNLK